MTRTFLFLADDPADARWTAVDDAAVVGQGRGLPDAGAVIAVAPADRVTLHWAKLPARSTAQATAAARIVVAEASAAPGTELHVAVGPEADGERPIAVVDQAAMTHWLATLARAGIDPVALVPAPLLVSAPDDGFVRAELGGRAVVRGRGTGFADEPLLTELITGGRAPATLDAARIEADLVEAAARLPLDLRQGPFARRRRRGIDWPLVRRSAALAGGILLLTLTIDLVRIAKYSFAADALETRAEQVAVGGLRRGETVVDPSRQLAERLGQVRGPGLGFAATVAAVFQGVQRVPGAEVTAYDFQPTGDLRLSVATAREAEATDLKRAIEAQGFRVDAGTFQSAGGRVAGEMTVRLP